MAQSFLRPGERVYISVDFSGRPTGAAPYIGKYPPRGQGYWVDITEPLTTCCSSTTSTTTTEA